MILKKKAARTTHLLTQPTISGKFTTFRMKMSFALEVPGSAIRHRLHFPYFFPLWAAAMGVVSQSVGSRKCSKPTGDYLHAVVLLPGWQLASLAVWGYWNFRA
jgi:hypothetical protein